MLGVVINEETRSNLRGDRVFTRLKHGQQMMLALPRWLQGCGGELLHHLRWPLLLSCLLQHSLGAREITDFLVGRQEPEPVMQHFGLHLAGNLKMPNGLRGMAGLHVQPTHPTVSLRMLGQNFQNLSQQFDGLLVLADLYVRVGLTQGAS